MTYDRYDFVFEFWEEMWFGMEQRLQIVESPRTESLEKYLYTTHAVNLNKPYVEILESERVLTSARYGPSERVVLSREDLIAEFNHMKGPARGIFETIKLSTEEAQKIGGLISEYKNFWPEDFENRVASEMVGMKYVADADVREQQLLADESLMFSFHDAKLKVKAVQEMQNNPNYSKLAPRIVTYVPPETNPSRFGKAVSVLAAAGLAAFGIFTAGAAGYALMSHPNDATTIGSIPQCAMKNDHGAIVPDYSNDAHVLKFTAASNNSEARVCYYGPTFYYQVKDFADNTVKTDVIHSLNFLWRGNNSDEDNLKWTDHLLCLFEGGSAALTHGDGNHGWIGVVGNVSLKNLQIKYNDFTSTYHVAKDSNDKTYYVWNGSLPKNSNGILPPLRDNGSQVFKIRFEVGYGSPNCCDVFERTSPTDLTDVYTNQNHASSFRPVEFVLPTPPVTTQSMTSSTSLSYTIVQSCTCEKTVSTTTSTTAIDPPTPSTQPIPEFQNALGMLAAAIMLPVSLISLRKKQKEKVPE